MTILWIPHTPPSTSHWDGARQYHLVKRLSKRHRIHLIDWKAFPSSVKLLPTFPRIASASNNVWIHTTPLLRNLHDLFISGYPTQRWMYHNQLIFQAFVNRCIARVRPHVLVYSSSHHFTGFPPFKPALPVVFDYVDRTPAWVRDAYVRRSTYVVAVTEELERECIASGTSHCTIPNGVDLERYRPLSKDKESAKRRLGLGDRKVISLIGLTCASDLYFLDAFKILERERDDIVLAVVGGGSLLTRVKARARHLAIRSLVSPGHVPNEEVQDYFAATDVGLYPGEDIPYYNSASPMKILEYTAARAQVVSSPVAMCEGWSNVRLVEPSAESFATRIKEALAVPLGFPDISQFSWETLTERFDQVLKTVWRQRNSQ